MELTLTRPDDFHVHLRDGAFLATTVPATATTFARAIVMPNLNPPLCHAQQVVAYKKRIQAHCPEGIVFEPLMTLYLTDRTTPACIQAARHSGCIYGAKLYPANVTTHSAAGVTALQNIYPVLEQMIECNLPLLVHGEVSDPDIDIFDREQVFIEQQLLPLCQRYPELKVVLEHITTTDAVDFVRTAGDQVGATITPQHLLYNRNDLLAGGIRPHYYCLPILKRDRHRQALVAAATGDDPSFFLGTDSAPHLQGMKESACGCAGCFSAPYALQLYAELFNSVGRLQRLEAFASHNGADFYGFARNHQKITLSQRPVTVPEYIRVGEERVIPLRAGESLLWSVRPSTRSTQ